MQKAQNVLHCQTASGLGTRDQDAADTDTGGYSRENVTGPRPGFPIAESDTKTPGSPENNPRGGGKQRRLINATNRRFLV